MGITASDSHELGQRAGLASGRARHERNQRGLDSAWTVAKMVLKSSEEQAKLSQAAWREIEVSMRRELRAALRTRGPKKPTQREIKDLTTAASIAQLRAYPETASVGLNAHVPARLLRSVSAVLLRERHEIVDVTPQPVVGPPDEMERVDVSAGEDGNPQ